MCGGAAAANDPTFAAACAGFDGLDVDADGAAEIARLTPIARAADAPQGGGARVVVLVEGRLLDPLVEADAAADLLPVVLRLGDDLALDGFAPLLVRVDLGVSTRHQDGLFLIALRRFLQCLYAQHDGLAGALLVGSFPDALLVRTCNWRRSDPLVVHQGQPHERRFANETPYLRVVPEAVAHTCDLILADLDGDWEGRYTRERERLETLLAVFPAGVPAHGGVAEAVERGAVEYEDYFHVNDGRYELRELVGEDGAAPRLRVVPLDAYADEECTVADRSAANAIAQPEIGVSRIDARGVAWSPAPPWVDDQGVPRALEHKPDGDAWRGDAWLERQLLIDYLERNHRYRRGMIAPQKVPASLAHDLPSGYEVLKAAASDWQGLSDRERDVHGRPDLAQAVAWFDRPALLRTIRAHSDPYGSAFDGAPVDRLEQAIGGPFYGWIAAADGVTPSARDAAKHGRLDFAVLYSRWRNRRSFDAASFYIHTGCEAISPGGYARWPYTDPRHARMNGAAAVLFFADGLALVGRAKVFYDEPRGFCEVLREGGSVGDAWRRYFDLESAEPMDRVGGDIGRKRAYFWSLLGDWTLRLPRP